MTVESFAAEIVRSPAGVALLQGLEVAQRSDLSMFESPTTIDAHAVEAAIHAAETMLLDELLHQIVHSADRFAGPWVSGVAQRLALAYELAPARMVSLTQSPPSSKRPCTPLCGEPISSGG